MNLIGISAFYHDSAVAYVRDGKIITALQEERFSRVKHDEGFPVKSLNYILSMIRSEELPEIDAFVFYEKPLQKFDRIFENYLRFAPSGYVNFRDSLPLWSQEKLFQRKSIFHEIEVLLKENQLYTENLKDKIVFSDHHLSHAASAYYPSPFKNSCVVTVDGVGEWTTTAIYHGLDDQLIPLKRIEYPHSLGLLYSTITSICGFKVNSGEYKLMGLAPYGMPKFAELILEEVITLYPDGSYELNLKYFDFMKTNRMYSNDLLDLIGVKARLPESEISQVYCDLAASIQRVLELALLNLIRASKDLVDSPNLCLAGGVALNCVANSEIAKSKTFERVWVQPASGDAGGALGAALAFEYMGSDKKKEKVTEYAGQGDLMRGCYLGREFSDDEIRIALEDSGLNYSVQSSIDSTIEQVAQKLNEGFSIGWFQGRSEFGPRSLGARSILADPRSPSTQKRLNLQIKFRESFRPFAPSILEEELVNWFDWEEISPYMLFVAQVKSDHRVDSPYHSDNGIKEEIDLHEKINRVRSRIPAVTHVDFSARIQTVSRKTNPEFHALISAFKKLTGVPILVNTSFNIRGEPIVDSPFDAIKCFLGTDIDVLVLSRFMVLKSENSSKIIDYRAQYKLD